MYRQNTAKQSAEDNKTASCNKPYRIFNKFRKLGYNKQNLRRKKSEHYSCNGHSVYYIPIQSALDSPLISDKHCRCHTYSNHQAIAMNSKIANRKQIIIHAYSPN